MVCRCALAEDRKVPCTVVANHHASLRKGRHRKRFLLKDQTALIGGRSDRVAISRSWAAVGCISGCRAALGVDHHVPVPLWSGNSVSAIAAEGLRDLRLCQLIGNGCGHYSRPFVRARPAVRRADPEHSSSGVCGSCARYSCPCIANLHLLWREYFSRHQRACNRCCNWRPRYFLRSLSFRDIPRWDHGRRSRSDRSCHVSWYAQVTGFSESGCSPCIPDHTPAIDQ